MRIISGKYKYRKLVIPHGIRPTTEKVREAVFSICGPWIDDASVIDLFAGSGALGLEALSRGASHCYFAESSRNNFKVLLANIESCGASENSSIYNCDYQDALSRLANLGIKADIVLLDPPYEEKDYYGKSMQLLQENEMLCEGSLIVAEHLYNNQLSDNYGNIHIIKKKRYGSIGVDVYIYEKRGLDQP